MHAALSPARRPGAARTARMAAHLAGHFPERRATPTDATLLLMGEGYTYAEIREGLDEALALVAQGIVAAASDHPVARAIHLGHDLAAGVAIAAALALGAVPSGWLA